MESLLGWMCDVAVRGKWTVMVMCLERGIVTEGPCSLHWAPRDGDTGKFDE